jgi:hypothetical protein
LVAQPPRPASSLLANTHAPLSVPRPWALIID